ncbi:hypothetical protein Tco_1089748 [Tanacetum coccineum]
MKQDISDAKENTAFEVIPLTVSDANARPKNLNPRFELFSMNVHVPHCAFKKGHVFGIVSLIDTDGLLSDQRLPLNKNDHGHVSYFYHDWDDAVGIGNNAYINFGNPSPPYSPPFSSVIELYVRLYATTLEKDKCFQICKRKFPIDLSKFWADKRDYKRGTLNYEGKDGRILIDYIMLRDAVDTTMELSFESPHDRDLEASVFGHIFAYYSGMLDDRDDFRQGCYKAILFQANADSTVKVGPVKLEKSVLAVPANGKLVIEALFLDVKTGEVILNKKSDLYPKPEGHDVCRMPWKNCSFNLTVEWSQGPKSFYT